MKQFLLPFIDKSFSFLPKKPFQILAERRVSRDSEGAAGKMNSEAESINNFKFLIELSITQFS